MSTITYAETSPTHNADEVNAVTIDCVLFGLNNGKLEILQVKHGSGIMEGRWGFPGGWILGNEDLDHAASRILQTLTGVDNTYLEQLQTFGKADRYPTKRVITVAYYALVKPEHYDIVAGFSIAEVKWTPLEECQNMIFDHDDILKVGLTRLKTRVKLEPIGFNLLPEKFTLLQLQELYETVLNIQLDKSNFRRKILKMGLLIQCEEKQKNVAHRAANLFKFDKDKYDELTRNGFVFDI